MTTRRSRRWFQLSLKSLFLLTLLVATFFAGYTLATKQAEADRQRAELEARLKAEATSRQSRDLWNLSAKGSVNSDQGFNGVLEKSLPRKVTAMPRVIYSLHLDCERVPGEPITGFVVPLNGEGNSQPGGIRPIGKPRVVDLRVGDWFLHRPTKKKYKVAGISAYRQHHLTEEQVTAGDIPKDGYVVPK